MNKLTYTLFLVLALPIVGTSLLAAEGIEFFHGTWEEALDKAQAEDKVIFVDAYTTWCGPCKRMAATVFTQKEVGDFFNDNFVCMKIDMEKEPGIRFQQKYPVSAYPTLYFIDGGGETVHKSKGAKGADKLIDLGKKVLGKVDKSGDFAKEYEAGNRDPELILKYVKALKKAGKSSGKIANEYINSQKDLSTDFNVRFLMEATTEADSRIFDKLMQQHNRAVALTSATAVEELIVRACEKTVQKAVEFSSADLLAEAKDKMKRHAPQQAASFALEADLRFHRGQKDIKNYLKATSNYAKKVAKNNASELHDLAKDIYGNFDYDAKAMSAAEKYAKQAAENGGLSKYYHTYASILFHNGKKAEALTMAQQALTLAKGNPREESVAMQLVRRIERE